MGDSPVVLGFFPVPRDPVKDCRIHPIDDHWTTKTMEEFIYVTI